MKKSTQLILTGLLIWVSIVRSQGINDFSRVDYPAGNGPYSVFAADLDNDGDIDLVTANEYGDNVSILLNNGNGTFSSPVNYATGDRPFSVYGADLDGDGDIDLVTANNNSGGISILLNNGDGSFASPINYSTGTKASSAYGGRFRWRWRY